MQLHHSSQEISETLTQNSIKGRGENNFRCVKVSFAFLLVAFVSEEIYLSQVDTHYMHAYLLQLLLKVLTKAF